MRLGHNLFLAKCDCGSHEWGKNRLPERERLRSRQFAGSDLAVYNLDADRNDPGLFFKGYTLGGLHLAELPRARENEGSPHVRMARKRYFSRWGEDSDFARMACFRRENERGLRVVELACDLLHLEVGQAGCLG